MMDAKPPELIPPKIWPYWRLLISLVGVDGIMEPLEEALATLTPREEKVLELRYGLHDAKMRTLAEIGAKYFLVTPERVRQIEAKALRKLRHPSRAVLFRRTLHNPRMICLRCSGLQIDSQMPLEELSISYRALHALSRADKGWPAIRTIGEVINKSEHDLLRRFGFGRKSLYELQEILKSLGLSLRQTSATEGLGQPFDKLRTQRPEAVK